MGRLIYLILSIIVILFIIYILNNYINKSNEPFVNPVVVSNVFVNPDEIFLVAANPSNFNINNHPDSFDYTTGVTYANAQAACQAIGPGVTLANLSTLATSPSKLSLNVAIDLSANWCAGGWVVESASTGYAYFPMTDFSTYKCRLADSTNASTNNTPAQGEYFLPSAPYGASTGTTPTYNYGVYNPGPNGKAFAICVGPKPPLPTAQVNPFNNNTYSMYNTSLMSYIETGVDASNPYNNDIFPVAFTDSQAYMALQNAPIPYNATSARNYLLSNYATDAQSSSSNALNASLQALEPSATASSWNSNAYNQSCTALSTIYTNMDNSLTALSALFSDLSGTVNNMISAKQENSVLQTTIANICLGPQASSANISAACSRLLSLDYDILYRNKSLDGYTQSNTITDLDSLNLALRVRECEIQQALGSLEEILTNLNCTSTLASLTAKYHTNTIVNSLGVKVPIDCNTYFDSNGNYSTTSTNYSAPTSAFKIGRDIQYNPVDNLKISLQQISPFFSGAQYSSLLSDVLNQLSVTLRNIPQDYSNIINVAKNTNTDMGLIENLFNYM